MDSSVGKLEAKQILISKCLSTCSYQTCELNISHEGLHRRTISGWGYDREYIKGWHYRGVITWN